MAGRHVSTPGYGAIIFRRTSEQITGSESLWEEANGIYPLLGGRAREHKLEWRFGTEGPDAIIKFSHLQYEKDKLTHQGKGYTFCVARGTPILMAGGVWRSIELICVGDMVETLEGPRRIIKTHHVGTGPAVRIATEFGHTVASANHKVMNASGAWVYPMELRSTVSCADDRSCELSRQQVEAENSPRAHRPMDCRRDPAQPEQPFVGIYHQAKPASPKGHQTGSEGSGDGHQGQLQLQSSYGRVALFGPVADQDRPGQPNQDHPDGVDGDPIATLTRDSGVDCPHGYRFYDGRSRDDRVAAQFSFPSPIDAVEHTAIDDSDDLGGIREHSRPTRGSYRHPYTNERRAAHHDAVAAWASISPAGEAELFDLTVEGASHYVSSGGLISQNCGFDELTHFTETQFWYLQSRNRSTCGVRPRTYATTNPDPKSWVRRLIAWWIGEDGLPIPERDGVLRYFVRVGDDLVWGDSAAEVAEETGRPEHHVKSLTFIRARLTDNRILTTVDPGYEATLLSLPRVERERLLGGNWDIEASAGDYFRRDWFKIIPEAPTKTRKRVRAWDLASTPVSSANPDPDWTVGARMTVDAENTIFVEHVLRCREGPHGVERAYFNAATQDGRRYHPCFWQDPGQAGKVQIANIKRKLLGFTVESEVARKDKVTYALPVSSSAEAGNIVLVNGPWLEPYLNSLEAFTGSPKDQDDDVDATSLGHLKLSSSNIEKLRRLARWR